MESVNISLQNSRLLLFDLDGTLLDSRDFLVDAQFRILETYYPGMCSYGYVVEHFGIGFAKMMADMNVPDSGPAREQFYEEKLTGYHEQSPPFAGVMDGLRQLKAAGFKLGVVTNQQKRVVFNALDAYGFDGLFDVVVTLEDVETGKPSPEGILQALRMVEETPERAVLIGDSQYDVMAARNAGIMAGLLTWYADTDATASGPDVVCADFAELLSHFKK